MFMIIIILGLFVEIFTSAVSACPFPETHPTARAKKHHGASMKEVSSEALPTPPPWGSSTRLRWV